MRRTLPTEVRPLRGEMPGLLAFTLTLAGFLLVGCEDTRIPVDVEQPIAFPHDSHLEYFLSGVHRTEKIQMHAEMFGVEPEEVPEEVQQGRCVECHESDLSDISQCARCHALFQDESLRARRELRPCVGCHPGTWNGTAAIIPTVWVCATCHQEKARSDSPEEARLREEFLARNKDVPWVQINTVPAHVHFSHSAHVRFGRLPCTRCHADVTELRKPPETATAFAMDSCVACHEEHNVSTDCLVCHQ